MLSPSNADVKAASPSCAHCLRKDAIAFVSMPRHQFTLPHSAYASELQQRPALTAPSQHTTTQQAQLTPGFSLDSQCVQHEY